MRIILVRAKGRFLLPGAMAKNAGELMPGMRPLERSRAGDHKFATSTRDKGRN